MTAHKISETYHIVKLRIHAPKTLHRAVDFRGQKSCKICHPHKVYGLGDVISLQSYASVFNSNHWNLLVILRQVVCRWTLTKHLVHDILTAKSTAACPGFWPLSYPSETGFSLSGKSWHMRNTFCFHTKRNQEVWLASETRLCCIIQGENYQNVGAVDELTSQQRPTDHGMERKSQELWDSMSDRHMLNKLMKC